MDRISTLVRRFVRDEEGATMPEYALMLALIAVVCITAVTAIGTQANLKFNNVANAIAGAGGGGGGGGGILI
jgi:pilus assembly protein Flp/PilA